MSSFSTYIGFYMNYVECKLHIRNEQTLSDGTFYMNYVECKYESFNLNVSFEECFI